MNSDKDLESVLIKAKEKLEEGMRAENNNSELISQAFNFFSDAISTYPCAETYFERAKAYKRIGDYNSTIRDITCAIRYQNCAELYAERGLVFLEMYNPESANRDFRTANKMSPTLAEEMIYSGDCELINKNKKGAITCYQLAKYLLKNKKFNHYLFGRTIQGFIRSGISIKQFDKFTIIPEELWNQECVWPVKERN